MPQSTITVQTVVNFASTLAELMPMSGVGGYTSEPALSIANDVMTELLAQPLDWKFNRAQMNVFVTQQNKQDYRFAGATAFTSTGGAAIGLATANAVTESGNTVTVNTIEAHNFSAGDTVYMTGNTVAAYNSTFTKTPSSSAWSGGWTILTTPTTTSFTFTHATGGLAASGAAGITDVSWLTQSTMVNMNDTSSSQFIWYLEAVRTLQAVSRVSVPDRISLLSDDGAGTITLRVRWLPGSQPFGITVSYQKRPTLLSSLSSTWAPFPDDYAFCYRQLFVAHALRYANSPRADIEYQKAMAKIMTAAGADDREQSEEFITPETPLMAGQGVWWGGWV